MHDFALAQLAEFRGACIKGFAEHHFRVCLEVRFARLHIHCALVTLECDPPLSGIMRSTEFESLDPFLIALAILSRHEDECFSNRHLTNNFALLNVELISHRTGGLADIYFLALRGKCGASSVPDTVPTLDGVLGSANLEVNLGRNGLLTWTFQQLKHLINLEITDLCRCLIKFLVH